MTTSQPTPDVVVTLLSVGSYTRAYCTIAYLSTPDGSHARRITRIGDSTMQKDTNVLICATRAIQALKRPATVHVVCNDRRAMRYLSGDQLAPPHAQAAAQDYFLATRQHRVAHIFARGRSMGNLGKAAYRHASERLDKATHPAEQTTPVGH